MTLHVVCLIDLDLHGLFVLITFSQQHFKKDFKLPLSQRWLATCSCGSESEIAKGPFPILGMSWWMVVTIGPLRTTGITSEPWFENVFACFFCMSWSWWYFFGLRTVLLCGSRSWFGHRCAYPVDGLWVRRETTPCFLVFGFFCMFFCKIFFVYLGSSTSSWSYRLRLCASSGSTTSNTSDFMSWLLSTIFSSCGFQFHCQVC